MNVRADRWSESEDAGQSNLVSSIRDVGLLSPLLVRPAADGRYELIAGQRRLKACRSLGWTLAPCNVAELSDSEAMVASLAENFQRAEMSPIDRSDTFARLRGYFGTAEEVAKRVHLSVATVRRYRALENLAPAVRERVTTGEGIEVLSELGRWFKQEHQEDGLEAVEGLKSGLQGWILRESDGDLQAILEIREQVLEDQLGLKVCHEGLCSQLEPLGLGWVRAAVLEGGPPAGFWPESC